MTPSYLQPPLLSEYTAHLRGIAAVPDDDLPRLVLADWLQEHDHAKRAEWIRIQCELAALNPHAPCGGYYCQTDDTGYTMHVDCRGEKLRIHERSLLHSFEFDIWGQFARWGEGRGWTMTTLARKPAFRVGPYEGHPDDITCTLARGFVHTICGPLELLLGSPCGR